jgi:hypothetical protein
MPDKIDPRLGGSPSISLYLSLAASDAASLTLIGQIAEAAEAGPSTRG